jgi:hypothetical protein
MVEIEFKLKFKDKTELQTLKMLEEEYFEDLEMGDVYEVDSCTRYEDPLDYLKKEDLGNCKIEGIKIQLYDKVNGLKKILHFIYWKNNRVSFNRDYKKNKVLDSEIIIDLFESDENYRHILKINDKNMEMFMHTLVITNGEIEEVVDMLN